MLVLLASIALVMSVFPGMAAAVGDAGSPSGDGIQPVALTGNPNCGAGDAGTELRINAPADGTFTHTATGFSITIDVRTTAAGQVFDYTSTGGTIFEIYVKAGPDTNKYDYGVAGSDGADTNLHGTINPSNGRFYGLSHISICFVPGVTTSVSTLLHERTDASGTTDVTPANNGKTISVTTGAWVNDVATVTPNSATGTVSFAVYPSLDDCNAQTNGTAAGSGIAVSGGTATSSTLQFNTAGTFYWRASFDGTGTFTDSLSPCDEILTVRQNTSVSTELHERTTITGDTDVTPANNGKTISVLIGAFVNDVATVTPSSATGSVSFAYYPTLDDCNAQTNGTAAGTAIAVSGGTATSTTIQFNAPGTFYWRASFDGSGLFNDSLSACDETLTVGPAATSISTAPWIYPNDDATISATVGGNVAGSVDFALYDTEANCTEGGATGRLFQQTVNLPGDATSSTVSTSNTTVKVESSTTVWWNVSFDSTNPNHQDRESICVEKIAVTFTDDAGPGTVPAP